jgi:hypothetical protein
MQFVAPLTVMVQLHFVDRGKRVSQVSYRLLASLSLDTMVTIALELDARISALSNAALFKRSFVWHYRNTDNDTPAVDSDARLYLDMLYTNSLDAIAYAIPSPRPEYFQDTAWGAGILLDRRDPGVSSLVTQFTAAIANTVREDGSPVSPIFWHGVFTR